MTVQIHGKPYSTVAERLALVHQAGKSLEVVDSSPVQCGQHWVWRCHILLDGKQYVGSAQVHLDARPGSADATDPFACAETSAVGRALAFAGILSSESISSADEVSATPAPQETLESITTEVRELGLATDVAGWQAFKRSVLGRDIHNSRLTQEHLGQLRSAIESYKLQGVPSSPAA
jgi:hypothetical protein